jgi:hypothetical protein
VFYPPPGVLSEPATSSPPSKAHGIAQATLASNRLSAQPVAAPAVPSHYKATAPNPIQGKEPPLPSKPRKVRALQDFEAQEPTDLPFHKGDTLFITKQIDENWYEGSLNGSVGIFPIGFVESIQ